MKTRNSTWPQLAEYSVPTSTSALRSPTLPLPERLSSHGSQTAQKKMICKTLRKKNTQQFQIILHIVVLGFVSPFSHLHFTQVENQCYWVQPTTIQPGRCAASTCEPLDACERTRLHDGTTSERKSYGETASSKDYIGIYIESE